MSNNRNANAPRNYRRLASLFVKNRLLRSLFCCSSNNSQSIFFFFIFNYVLLFSFCTQIFLFTRCEVAENDNCRQWLQNNWLLPVNNCWSWIWLKRAKQTLACVQPPLPICKTILQKTFTTNILSTRLTATGSLRMSVLRSTSVQASVGSSATKFNDFKHVVGKREFLCLNHYTKIFCFCVHSGAPDLIYPETSLYEHILWLHLEKNRTYARFTTTHAHFQYSAKKLMPSLKSVLLWCILREN